MVRALICGLVIGVAATPVPAEVISPAKALAMAREALSEAGIVDAEPIAPSRALPACLGPISTGPNAGQWTTISFRCAQPTWTRLLRTRSKSDSVYSAGPRQGQSPAPEMAVGLVKSLGKDTLLTAEDLVLVPISDLGPDQVFSSPENLIGRRLNRSVGGGRPVLARHLQPDWKILSGQPVLITSGKSGIQITMRGRAMSNGAIGELIEVENLSSGRVISARVIQKDIVEVVLKPFENRS